MIARPGPCERCDNDGEDYCIGVPYEGSKREYHRCPDYRRWWDAGHAAAQEWQPIATAVGLLDVLIRFRDGSAIVADSGYANDDGERPTHWMPVPKGPKP